ncbi:MAG: hypothetical protein RIS76_958 [Verrucomicrobiota bacterium]|jgi:type VI protein secretion system component Hcp
MTNPREMIPNPEAGSRPDLIGQTTPVGSSSSRIRPVRGGLWWAISLAVCGMFLRLSAEPGLIIINIPSVPGSPLTIGTNFTSTDYFKLNSLSFGVNRDNFEPLAGGTADVNIGIGTLQSVRLTKTLDSASAILMRKAISGSSVGLIKIYFIKFRTVDGASVPYVYLAYQLDNVFVKAWSIASEGETSPTEAVELYYDKIMMATATLNTDGTLVVWEARWDRVKSKPWSEAPSLIPADGALPINSEVEIGSPEVPGTIEP